MSPKTILIVGANRGIGLGLVEHALKTYPDATVFATARDPTKAKELNELAKSNSSRLHLVKADMIDAASLPPAVEEIKKVTQSLDWAIFNAGIAIGGGKIEDLKPDVFLENLEANVVGPHNLFRAFSPLVLASESDHRVIAVTSSAVGSIGALPQVSHFIKGMTDSPFYPMSGYATTKSAVNMLGRQWADSLEPQKVVVALVHPGAVATDMNNGKDLISVDESAQGFLKQLDEVTLEKAGKGIISYNSEVYPW